jgi:hypothetical protein
MARSFHCGPLSFLCCYSRRVLSAAHYRLQALPQLVFLSVRVAFNGVWPHCHWAGVHLVILETRSDFLVRQVAPTVSFSQPSPTARAV